MKENILIAVIFNVIDNLSFIELVILNNYFNDVDCIYILADETEKPESIYNRAVEIAAGNIKTEHAVATANTQLFDLTGEM